MSSGNIGAHMRQIILPWQRVYLVNSEYFNLFQYVVMLVYNTV